jgi:hypothetical protein
MHKNKIIIFYLILLLLHVAHVLEEVWGMFRAIEFFGFGGFLLANWVLLCIPFVFFYFLLNEKRWGYILCIVYAGIMFFNGLGHNIATIVTGKYFDGFAGGFTGIGFIIISPALIYYLLKDIKKV